jgi:hypothetical protein
MWDYIWDSFVSLMIAIFLPMVCLYHAICGNVFLNVSVENATGLEKAGNTLLIPFQYVFAGKIATQEPNGEWVLEQRFSYDEQLLTKSVASALSLPWSLLLGSTVKALSFCTAATREHHVAVLNHIASTKIQSNLPLYKELGIEVGNMANAGWLRSGKHARKPGDEKHLNKAKECLQEVAQVLTKAGIPWWIDCGTLLGAYRYGGIIPWDNDIDVAMLLPDFENARRALNQLDPEKYTVQDWSGRDFPNTFLKIYVHESGDLVDVYFYDIDEETRECSYIFALDQSIFFFDWWKEGERRFTKPVAFHTIFPLKRAMFDGIEVFVPNETVPFLQRYYGENLSPAKIYDSQTGRFEKDLSHPYWQNPYVH